MRYSSHFILSLSKGILENKYADVRTVQPIPQAAQHIAATVHEMDALMVNVQELVQGFVLEEGGLSR